MKLKDTIVISNIGNETVLVSSGNAESDFHGIIKLNETGAFLAECLKEDCTEDALLQKLKESFMGDAVLMQQDIRRLLDKFIELGIVEEA